MSSTSGSGWRIIFSTIPAINYNLNEYLNKPKAPTHELIRPVSLIHEATLTSTCDNMSIPGKCPVSQKNQYTLCRQQLHRL